MRKNHNVDLFYTLSFLLKGNATGLRMAAVKKDWSTANEQLSFIESYVERMRDLLEKGIK